MKNWPESPFCEYQCNKCSTYFVIATKHMKTHVVGEDYTSWANEDCPHKLYKNCYVKHTMVSDKVSAYCKVRDNKRKPPASRCDDDVEMEESNDK